MKVLAGQMLTKRHKMPFDLTFINIRNPNNIELVHDESLIIIRLAELKKDQSTTFRL